MERPVWQAHGQGVDPWQDGIERAKRGKGKACVSRTLNLGGRQAQFGDDTVMIEGQVPGPGIAGARKEHRPLRRRRAETGPAILLAQRAPETVLPRRLAAFLGDDETLRHLDHATDPWL